MSVAAVLQNLSIENASLLLGGLVLFAVIIGLHVRNIRWVQRLANSEASMEAKARIEKLINAVEKLSSGPQRKAAANPRPVGKGRKAVPAIRSARPSVPLRRAR
jgi:hypothetical protein